MATFSNGTTTSSYKYNEDGVRTSKTVGDTTTYFFVDGTTILAQRKGNTQNAFFYDANGKRIAFRHGGIIYYYVYNLQGDVTHILNESGNIVGTYEYDAWGKITNLDELTAVAKVNPFRYRGYYYDTESGLYYLNSRYYNPEWGRFLNADGYVTTSQGLTSYNMFVYCGNNPIINIDPDGTCPYNGTAADFHRLEQGLPSLDCTCLKNIDTNINAVASLIKTGTISYIDDVLNNIVNNASLGLNSGLEHIYKALNFASNNFGLMSILFGAMDIVWDYNSYKNDMDSFWTSTSITLASTTVTIIATGIIAALEWPLTATFIATGIAITGITLAENKIREKYLND